MSTVPERLLEIAQQLDELAGDGASVLITLSEELGKIAAEWPEKPKPDTYKEMPLYLRRIQQEVEREFQDRRHGRGMDGYRIQYSILDEIAANYPITLSTDSLRHIRGGGV